MVEVILTNEKSRQRSELISRIHRDRQHYLGNDSRNESNVTNVTRVNKSNPKAISISKSTDNEHHTGSCNRSQRKERQSKRKNGCADGKKTRRLGRFEKRGQVPGATGKEGVIENLASVKKNPSSKNDDRTMVSTVCVYLAILLDFEDI